MPSCTSSLVLLTIVAGCAEERAEPCSALAAVKAADRKILGEAAPYPGDPTLAAREAELASSEQARRRLAWSVVEKVLSPVTVAETGLAAGPAPTVPAFRTWYGRDDFERLFARLYEGLGPDGRRARQAFASDAIDDAFTWNVHAVEEQETWPADRWQEYLAAIDSAEEVDGVGGSDRVSYSPAVARHLLENYLPALDCLDAPEPPAVDGAFLAPARQVSVTRRGVLEPCDFQVHGPFPVGRGATLSARLVAGDGKLYVERGAPPTAAAHDCAADGRDDACTVEGGAQVWVAIAGRGDGGAFELTIEYGEAEAENFSRCFARELPFDAAVVKADFRRAQFGETLAVYDTSPARMATRLRAEGAGEWGPGDGIADPGADRIYTVTLPSEARFRLAGLHIATKELRHWVWITLWWSDRPDSDFGADRPASITGPWRNYKMCVATTFEADGAPTWCSNPYLEEGHENARTNCIGCHQHAGTRLRSEEILEMPLAGTTKVRNNFPADYLWSLTTGDEIGRAIQAEVDAWEAQDALP
jgi:hypothetical protein